VGLEGRIGSEAGAACTLVIGESEDAVGESPKRSSEGSPGRGWVNVAKRSMSPATKGPLVSIMS